MFGSSCHTGQEVVFTIGKIDFYAGGRNRNGGWQKAPIIPDLAMGPSETLNGTVKGTTVPKGWKCEGELPTPPMFVSFDWPDFSIPNVEKAFWIALVDDITSKGLTSISCQCAGGHGRTGVQLSILAYLLSKKPQWKTAEELVLWVREKHCEHAVENLTQQKYIAEVCDIEVGASTIKEIPKPVTKVTTTSNNFYNVPTYLDDIEVYCATCEEESIVADDSEVCETCGDDVMFLSQAPKQKSKRKKVAKCIICEEGELDENEYCISCDSDNYAWKQDSLEWDNLCLNCGVECPSHSLMGDVCSICHGEKLGMKVRDRDLFLQCDKCSKYKPADVYFHKKEDSKVCMKCVTHKDKPKSKKQKTVDDYIGKYKSVGKKKVNDI